MPPGGESYAQVAVRIRRWYESLDRDTVVAAHGGTARALIAHLGLAPPQDATHYSIDQGVVYVFSANGLARYA
jgi:probable phosphoglycerate mutase